MNWSESTIRQLKKNYLLLHGHFNTSEDAIRNGGGKHTRRSPTLATNSGRPLCVSMKYITSAEIKKTTCCWKDLLQGIIQSICDTLEFWLQVNDTKTRAGKETEPQDRWERLPDAGNEQVVLGLQDADISDATFIHLPTWDSLNKKFPPHINRYDCWFSSFFSFLLGLNSGWRKSTQNHNSAWGDFIGNIGLLPREVLSRHPSALQFYISTLRVNWVVFCLCLCTELVSGSSGILWIWRFGQKVDWQHYQAAKHHTAATEIKMTC